MSVEEILENYRNELSIEIKLNKLNLSDHQVKLPALKHKWASRYINHKHKVYRLKAKKKELFRILVSQKIDESPVRINVTVAEKTTYSHPDIQKIDSKIQEQELILEYLEKIQNIVNNIQWDIKNLIEIEKLEIQ